MVRISLRPSLHYSTYNYGMNPAADRLADLGSWQGEKPTIALINPAASARMAVAEALMNIAAGDLLDGLQRIRLSCNWMTAIVRITGTIPYLLAFPYESQDMAPTLCCPMNYFFLFFLEISCETMLNCLIERTWRSCSYLRSGRGE